MATTTFTPASRSGEHRFFVGITSAMLLVIFVGFARSFFLRPLFPGWPSPAEPIFYVHGVLFTLWCVLLVIQPSLVAAGRTVLHRRVGVWGAVLAAAMVVFGFYVALLAAARPTGFVGVPIPGLQFVLIPLTDLLLFAIFVTLAILKRRDFQAHKRWMLLASINFLTPGFARWPVIAEASPLVAFGLSLLFCVSLAVWDFRSRGRLHPATLWGSLIFLISVPIRLAVLGTSAWVSLAGWMVRLVQ